MSTEDTIQHCLERAQAQYQQRLEAERLQTRNECTAMVPEFLQRVRSTVTADSLSRHHGAVYLPIRAGCFPTFARALSECGINVANGALPDQGMKCDCMLFMTGIESLIVASPSNLSKEICDRLNQ